MTVQPERPASQHGVGNESPGQVGFDLDVSLVEVSDPAGLVNLTDDGCGSTCGACVTNVA